MDLDQDWDNNPEFMEFVQTENQNANGAVFAQLKEQLVPEFEKYAKQVEDAALLAIQKVKDDAALEIQKVKDDAAKGIFHSATTNTENQQHPSAAPASVAKASAGQIPSTAVKKAAAEPEQPATKKKAAAAQRPRAAPGKSSTVKRQKAVASAAATNVPEGQVRIEVLKSSNKSNIGMVKFVAPVIPSAPSKQVNIGRSTSKHSKEFGFPIEDDEVSTKHAMIHRKIGKFYVKDMSSTNGTELIYPNGETKKCVPHEHYLLEDGTIAQLGVCQLLINFSS